MNRSLWRAGLLAPLAALTVLSAAPAQARTDGDPAGATVTAPVSSAATAAATAATAATATPAVSAGNPASASSAAPVPPDGVAGPVPARASVEETDIDPGVSRVVSGCGDTATDTTRDAGRDATTIVATAPDASTTQVGAANKQVNGALDDVAADCAAAAPDPVRRLTGPVPGAVFEGSQAPRGMIPERSLS